MSSSKDAKNQDYNRHPFLVDVDELTAQLDSHLETGLTALKAQQAQREYGPNKLQGEGGVQWYQVLLKQISNAMILVRAIPSFTLF